MHFNTKNAQKGFTIVELLIVIVVIGILAAITIVAYNGIQNRGKAAAGLSLANSVIKKAEAYNTIKTGYPSHATFIAVTTDPAEAKLDNPSAVISGSATAAHADGKTVGYALCGTTGASVTYWDATVPGVKSLTTGTGC